MKKIIVLTLMLLVYNISYSQHTFSSMIDKMSRVCFIEDNSIIYYKTKEVNMYFLSIRDIYYKVDKMNNIRVCFINVVNEPKSTNYVLTCDRSFFFIQKTSNIRDIESFRTTNSFSSQDNLTYILTENRK
jgi:hypothetical protein